MGHTTMAAGTGLLLGLVVCRKVPNRSKQLTMRASVPLLLPLGAITTAKKKKGTTAEGPKVGHQIGSGPC